MYHEGEIEPLFQFERWIWIYNHVNFRRKWRSLNWIKWQTRPFPMSVGSIYRQTFQWCFNTRIKLYRNKTCSNKYGFIAELSIVSKRIDIFRRLWNQWEKNYFCLHTKHKLMHSISVIVKRIDSNISLFFAIKSTPASHVFCTVIRVVSIGQSSLVVIVDDFDGIHAKRIFWFVDERNEQVAIVVSPSLYLKCSRKDQMQFIYMLCLNVLVLLLLSNAPTMFLTCNRRSISWHHV